MLDKIKEAVKQIPEGWINFFVKVVLVSLLAISIKIAVQMKKERLSILNAFLSVVIGVGVAVMCGNAILHYFSSYWATIAIATITIIGEKIANWLIYKLKVDKLMEDLLKYLTRKK